MSADSETREFKRKKRIADTLITAHNILGERYRKVSVVFDIGLMLTSFAILLLSILDLAAPAFLVEIIGNWRRPAIVIGAIVIFTLSVIEWRISWKGKSESHFRTAGHYSSIKGEITALLSRGIRDGDIDAAQIEDRYDRLGLTCIRIPHNKFVKLKRMHLRKVALSRLLDDQPFAISFVIRLKLALKDTSKGWSKIE